MSRSLNRFDEFSAAKWIFRQENSSKRFRLLDVGI